MTANPMILGTPKISNNVILGAELVLANSITPDNSIVFVFTNFTIKKRN
jgi:serine acetyltransferase